MGPKQPAKKHRKGSHGEGKIRGYGSTSAWVFGCIGPGGEVARFKGSALPQAAPSVRAAPSSCLRPSGRIAWASEKSKEGPHLLASSAPKGIVWPGLVGLIFSFLTGSQESGFGAGVGWGVRQAGRGTEGWGRRAPPSTPFALAAGEERGAPVSRQT